MAFPELRKILADSCMMEYTVKDAKEYLVQNGYGRNKIGDLIVTLDGDEGFRVRDFVDFQDVPDNLRAATELKRCQSYQPHIQYGYEDTKALETMFEKFVFLVIAMMNCFGQRKTNCEYIFFTIDNELDVYGRTICVDALNIISVNIKEHVNGVHLMETLVHEVAHALLLPYDAEHGYEFYRTGAAVLTLAKSMFGPCFKELSVYTEFDAVI